MVSQLVIKHWQRSGDCPEMRRAGSGMQYPGSTKPLTLDLSLSTHFIAFFQMMNDSGILGMRKSSHLSRFLACVSLEHINHISSKK